MAVLPPDVSYLLRGNVSHVSCRNASTESSQSENYARETDKKGGQFEDQDDQDQIVISDLNKAMDNIE